MLITRATEYAIRAVLYMAKQPRGEIVYKRDICRSQDVTPAFLTKILQPLIKAGVVGSQRGVGGGFYLLKDPASVTLLDIVRAEEGPLYINQCLVEPGSCNRDLFCPVHGAWKEIRDQLSVTLGSYSFQDLIDREGRLPSSTKHR